MRIYTAIFLIAVLASCASEEKEKRAQKEEPQKQEEMSEYAKDTHSFSEPNKVAATHLNLDIDVNFEKRIISGIATYDLERTEGNKVIFDVRGLEIKEVTASEDDSKLEYEIRQGDKQGDALEVTLGENTGKISIRYNTSSDAAAVLWMDPEQTKGKKDPFLFTQGQAILTRSWIPVQDTPSIRITYEATVSVPDGLLAVMSAENPQRKNEEAQYNFKMDQPIPPYLLALAVGDLAFEELGPRSGVYAEPDMIEDAAYEFAETEEMIEAAEDLYGPYRWDRYDILVLPPSFPFGGMENPRLTFATPTIIAGDRSLTSLIAHELAHSWSGNLVTNATWNDFWLNEGFTVYFEKRIMEEVYGKDYAAMLNELGLQDLKETVSDLGAESDDTKLKLDLEGRDPDDGMTDIAYEKGYLFLRWLESKVGRDRFDKFLRNYFDENAFKTMTTESFVQYIDKNLLDELEERPNVEAWIYKSGIPENYPVPESDRFDKVDSVSGQWLAGSTEVEALPAKDWSTHEWLHFLRGLSEKVDNAKMASLDQAYDLTNTGNSEIAAEWFLLAIKNNYREAFPAMKDFLISVGRRKFLRPLYEELAKTEVNKKWAKEVYAEARSNYHSVSTQTIDEILDWERN